MDETTLPPEAFEDAEFRARWSDPSDESFRSLAVAALELRESARAPAASRRSLIRDLCTRKRRDLLAEAVGQAVPERAVRWLGRMAWAEFAREDWRAFFAIASDASAASLARVERITPTLVRQFGAIPEELRFANLLDVASRLTVPHGRWRQLHGFLREAGPDERARIVRSARGVRSNGDFWDFFFRCEGKHWRPFALPAVLGGSALLEPIDTPHEMEREALRLRNCLASRVSVVAGGRRVYFRLRNGEPVHAELVRHGHAWRPGEIFGPDNALVPQEDARRIRAELQWLAEAMAGAEAAALASAQDASGLRRITGESPDARAVQALIGPLRTIQGRSRSWDDGAWTIFELDGGGFVQFMSNPDGTEYLCEIASHKFQPGVSRALTGDAVDMIEACGFQWPSGRANFLRWFDAVTEDDFRLMAEIALVALERVFRHRGVEGVGVRTHIP